MYIVEWAESKELLVIKAPFLINFQQFLLSSIMSYNETYLALVTVSNALSIIFKLKNIINKYDAVNAKYKNIEYNSFGYLKAPSSIQFNGKQLKAKQ